MLHIPLNPDRFYGTSYVYVDLSTRDYFVLDAVPPGREENLYLGRPIEVRIPILQGSPPIDH
jgi:hypothetical protein